MPLPTQLLAACILVLFLASEFLSQPIDGDTKEEIRRKVKSGFSTARVQVSLSCASDDIVVNLNFTRPFRGIAHAGPKDSACRLEGDGAQTYVLKVPLDKCGTIAVEPSGSFSNTLTVRFHPSLELEGDEIKTIICRFATGSVHVG